MADYHIRLKNRVHPINVVIKNLTISKAISVVNNMVLESNRLLTELQQPILLDGNDMVLESNIGDKVFLTISEKVENDVFFDVILNNTVFKIELEKWLSPKIKSHANTPY